MMDFTVWSCRHGFMKTRIKYEDSHNHNVTELLDGKYINIEKSLGGVLEEPA